MIRALLVLSTVLLLLACPGGKPCQLHSDCPETERCKGGTCTLICRVDRDCEGLGSCVQGQCVLLVNGGGAGGSSGGGTGTAGGASGGGMAGGAAGGGSGGSAGGAAGGSAGGAAGGSAGGSAGGVAGGAAGGSAGGGTGGGSMGTGMYGDLCTSGSQCQSTLCLGLTGSAQGVCTIPCSNESACMSGWACLYVGGTKLCAPSDSGRSCSGSAANCVAGICVGGSNGVCATPCESTRACPTNGNFTCSPSVGVNGRICIPAGATCNSSSSCISNFCERKSVSPFDGVCTSVCRTSADCPAGWACGLDDDGSGTMTTISVCQPVGGTCTINGSGMNDCHSQTCATPDTGGANYCTALCMNTQLQPEPARCPAGWSCSAVPVGMATWYACEPP